MKKISLCLILLVLSVTSFCQPAGPLTRDEYLKKSKSQKVAGFILLGAGALGLISVSGGNTNFDVLGPIVVVSSLAVIGSIPLFIASGRNKRKARNASVSFNFENTRSVEGARVRIHSFPALSIHLNL